LQPLLHAHSVEKIDILGYYAPFFAIFELLLTRSRWGVVVVCGFQSVFLYDLVMKMSKKLMRWQKTIQKYKKLPSLL
jgi:hypothetical protein